MIGLYKVLSYFSAPFLRIYFYWRCYSGKDLRESVKNHFGEPTTPRPEGRICWIHAASIGESAAAMTYIKHLQKKEPDLHVLLTTITVTSAEILQSKLKSFPQCVHQFVVADNPFWVRKFLDYWRPETAIFLESEIWPNITDELHARGIPMFLLNARMSPRSFRRWSYLKSDCSAILKKFTGILAQSESDAHKYGFFSPHNVYQIDNLKYANEPLPCNERLLKLLKLICASKKVFVAASTHTTEEETILNAHLKLRESFDLVTIIIPRHLTRIGEIRSLLESHKVTYALRSELTEQSVCEVICVDTFGDVGTCYRMADVTFVGGSLVPIGGHNIYEPVALGKPVLHGPHMENAIETRDFLAHHKVAFEVRSVDDLVMYCSEFFSGKNLPNETTINQTIRNNALQQIDAIIKFNKV